MRDDADYHPTVLMTSAMTLVHLILLPLVLVATVSGLREQELQCEPIKIEQVTYLPTYYIKQHKC